MRGRGVIHPLPAAGGRPPGRQRIGRLWSKALPGLCFLALLWGGQALYTVREINVSGCRLLDREEVAAAAQVQAGRSIWLFSPSRAAVRVERLPQVRRATVERSNPWTVCVTVEEREPAAAILAGNGFWTVDREGVIIGGPEAFSVDLPVVTGLESGLLSPGETVARSAQGQALQELLQALACYPGLEVSELNVKDPGDLLLFTMGGLQVLLGDSAGLEAKLELVWQSMPHWRAGGVRCVDARLSGTLVVSP